MVVKLNASRADADLELEQTKKKLAAMEKLNRTLTAERSQLLKGKKDPNQQTYFLRLIHFTVLPMIYDDILSQQVENNNPI